MKITGKRIRNAERYLRRLGPGVEFRVAFPLVGDCSAAMKRVGFASDATSPVCFQVAGSLCWSSLRRTTHLRVRLGLEDVFKTYQSGNPAQRPPARTDDS